MKKIFLLLTVVAFCCSFTTDNKVEDINKEDDAFRKGHCEVEINGHTVMITANCFLCSPEAANAKACRKAAAIAAVTVISPDNP